MTVYLTEVEVLMEMIDGLKKAAGCAHAMAHYQQNPKWLKVRDNLEMTVVACQELATAKSMPRFEVENVIKKLDEKAKAKLNEEVGN